jgi:ATP-dependent Clp protease ATP-binding subunit ClpC
MTSNIGLTEFNKQAALGFQITDKSEQQKLEEEYEHLQEKIQEGLKDTFRPEFLNRIDKIIIFKPLSHADALKIAKLQMNELAERIKQQGYYLKVSPQVYKQIVTKGFSAEQGARGIRKAVQDEIENMLATSLLSNQVKSGETLKLKVNKDKIIMER